MRGVRERMMEAGKGVSRSSERAPGVGLMGWCVNTRRRCAP